MATTVIQSIGTTGRDFSTIGAWEAATDIDLVAADEIRIGQLYPDTDFDEEVVIAGATVDATRYRQLEAAPGFEHGGTPGAGVVWRKTTASDNPTIDIQENFFRLFQIEFKEWKVLTTFGNVIAVQLSSADDVRCGYLLFDNPSGTNSPKITCINVPFGSSGFILYNIFMQQIGTVASVGRGTGAALADVGDAFNITMRDLSPGAGSFSGGFTMGGGALLKNCVCLNCGDGSNTDDFAAGFSASSDFNAGSDTSAPGASSIDNITSAEFVSASNIHKVGGSQLIDAGVDPSSVFSDDIDLRSRPQGAEWDMGGDEFPSAGPGPRGIIVVSS